MDSVIATRDMAEWDRVLREHNIVFALVQGNEEIPHDRQMEASGVFDEIAPGMKTVSSPLQVHGVTKAKPGLAPRVGEHTREILVSLGYSDSEIEELVRTGAAMAGVKKSALGS